MTTMQRIAHALYVSAVVTLCFTMLMLWLCFAVLIARATIERIA